MDKRWKLLIVLGVVAVGVAIAYVGSLPEGFKTVSEVVEHAHVYEGRVVELKATVKPGSLNETEGAFRFAVTDDVTTLPVLWTKPIPNHEAGGTIEGRTVNLKGTLTRDPVLGLVFHAEDMTVGCASKYEGNTTGNATSPQAASMG